MKYLTLFIPFFISFSPHPGFAQISTHSDSIANLTAAENKMFVIITTGDTAGAPTLFAPDFITINADGTKQNRREALQTFGKFKGSTFALSDRMVRIYGNTAIITGKAKFFVKSILVAEVLYTEVWEFRNGWDFVGWQGTMTGLPSWYPVIIELVLFLVALLVFRLIYNRRRRRQANLV